MKKILLALCLTCCLYNSTSSLYAENAGFSFEFGVGADDEDDDIVWGGPGWYYGLWFSNQYEYSNWHRHHRGHHHGRHHHDGRHGGGRHHGGRHH